MLASEYGIGVGVCLLCREGSQVARQSVQVYDYETGLSRKEDGSRDDFKAKIVATRSLGAFDSDGQPMVADDGDLGLSGYLAQMNANWLVLKPRLGINNPQQYTTWFSLRKELFRIYGDATGDKNWKAELKKYWTDDIQKHPVYQRHCQKFQSQFGLKDREPGFVIPFSTTIDFAKNLFGNDLAGGDHAYDSTWYSTRIASAGVWFDGYNELTADADWEGTDPTVKIRRHPMFRAYYGSEGAQPTDDRLDATRLIGRSVWNDQWYLIIPAGSMNADREKAMNAFLGGYDANRDEYIAGTNPFLKEDVFNVRSLNLDFWPKDDGGTQLYDWVKVGFFANNGRCYSLVTSPSLDDGNQWRLGAFKYRPNESEPSYSRIVTEGEETGWRWFYIPKDLARRFWRIEVE